MGPRALLLLMIMLISLAGAASTLTCADLLSREISAQDIEKTIQSLADLKLKIDLAQARGERSPYLATLKRDFDRQKRELLELLISQGQSEKQFNEHMAVAINKLQHLTDESGEQERVARQQQTVSAIFTEILSEDIGALKEFESINAMEDTFKKYSDSRKGPLWTADEEFVVFRNLNGKVRIFNTKLKRFIDIQLMDGYLSQTGHYWVENFSDQSFVTDLETGQRWGPFDGGTINFREAFTSDFLITNVPNVKVTSVVPDYSIHYFKTGNRIHLGQFFSFSNDHSKVARSTADGFEVIDLATEQPLDVVRCKLTGTSWEKGFVSFYKDQKYFVYRLSDGQVFETPRLAARSELSDDGNKLISANNSAGESSILNLANGKSTALNLRGYVWSNVDRTKVIFKERDANNVVVIDLKTMKATPVPGVYNRFSPNGRWLYRNGGQLKERSHQIYDLETNTEFSFSAGPDLEFVGNTDDFLHQDPPSEDRNEKIATYIGDARTNHAYQTQIGEIAAVASPRGTYIVTYRDDRVTILQTGTH